MMEWIQLGTHAFITILAVAGLALRIEHRLTKIETDVSWLIKNNSSGCEGKDQDVGESREVSQEDTD